MTAKAFISLLLLIPLLFVAGNPQLLGQLESRAQALAEKARPYKEPKPVDWRKAEREREKANNWRKKSGAVEPNSFRAEKGTVSSGPMEATAEPVQVLEGTEQVPDNTTIEGLEPVEPVDPAEAREARAERGRTGPGKERLTTERSTPGEVGGVGTAGKTAAAGTGN